MVEITDAMITRGCRFYYGDECYAASAKTAQRETMRKILDAALNPPPVPEIVVTEGMRCAGIDAYCQTHKHLYQTANSSASGECLAAAYRAMRALEEKGPEAPPGQFLRRIGGSPSFKVVAESRSGKDRRTTHYPVDNRYGGFSRQGLSGGRCVFGSRTGDRRRAP